MRGAPPTVKLVSVLSPYPLPPLTPPWHALSLPLHACTLPALQFQVPLTQSLYVPGRIVEADKMMVDVGTGYFVQKDQQKTAEFLGRKVSSAQTLVYLRTMI